MTDLLQEDHDKAKTQALHAVQDKLTFYDDVCKTFGTEHGRRVLKDIADEKYLYDDIFAKTNALTNANIGIQSYIRRILDIVAAADPETYQWLMMQRVNELRAKFTEEQEDARRE